jgi:hypothetical protein
LLFVIPHLFSGLAKNIAEAPRAKKPDCVQSN